MANVRDSDTSLWLHNKLGASGDLWSGGSICSQLTQDVLRNIKDCFIDLQSQVKLKLLLSFLHINRRNVEEWKSEMEEILELAVVDSDQWVSMLAELLKSYPATGTINMEIEENARLFTDLLTDLKKLVKKHCDQGMMPLECLYLNKNALGAMVGQQPAAAKHFTLKRKPKSAALRAELLQKSVDAANSLKKNSLSSCVPVRSRGIAKRMEDTTPLKGFPSRSPLSNFRSPGGIRQLGSTPTLPARSLPKTPAGRKDGGIKLLEITEQPIGFGREAKRRKKMAEEGNEAIKKEKEASASPTATATTPEYAAGLVSSITPQLSTPSTLTATFASSIGGVTTTPPTPTAPNSAGVSASPLSSAAGTTITAPSTLSLQARENLQNSLQTQATRIQIAAAGVTAITVAPTPVTVTLPTAAVVVGATTTSTAQLRLVTTNAAAGTLQPAPSATQPLAAAAPKKGLSLTREQMQEAQEMFRTANKVTRPEKALILGFMAGARDNPCPHLGNVVTIKLSENQEPVTQVDGAVINMMVEVHFQMNYNTGEWKRVKKLRKIEE